ncbi:MAG: uracil-DNA glycosylase family protein, partial [Firmicutes bacterium]|nr:uracil-DNA glycosylase family protein [Bacillota bacterium]
MEYEHIVHPFGPLYDARSKILILGSLPSVKSREASFFYGHPQNRYWPLMASLLGEPVPATVEEKKELVLSHRIAMWDSIYSCDIRGSG